MSDYYLLEGEEVVPCKDVLTWAESPKGLHQIWRAKFHGKDGKEILISTVFLGLNHQFSYNGPPIVFETMVFGGTYDEYQERYATYAEAKAGHRRAVDKVLEKK